MRKTLITLCTLTVLSSAVLAQGPQRERPTFRDRADAGNEKERMMAARQAKMKGGGEMQEDRLLGALISNPRFAQQLELSDEQVATLKGAVQTQRTAFEDLKKQVQAAAMEQARLITQQPVDEAALMAAVDRGFELRAQMAKLKIKQLLMMREVLTPEQQQRARSMMQARRNQMRGEQMRGDRVRPERMRPGADGNEQPLDGARGIRKQPQQRTSPAQF